MTTASPAVASQNMRQSSSKAAVIEPSGASLPVISCVIGFSVLTAWIAAGSGGLIGHALRHALAFCGMIAIVLSAVQIRNIRLPHKLLITFVLLASIVITGRHTSVSGAFCVAALVSSLLLDARFTQLRPLAFALFTFAVYRFAVVSIPSLWLLADGIGSALGGMAGWIVGTPLRVGITYGGVDLLVLSLAFAVAWCWGVRSQRVLRLCIAVAMVFLAILASLAITAAAPVFLAWAEGTAGKEFAAKFIPWNLPIFGVLFLTGINVTLARWFPGEPTSAAPHWRWTWLTPLIALLLPIVTTLSPTSLSLQDRKIVLYEKGFLNWMRPEHGEGFGRLSIGMYGMLSQFLEMHGAKPMISKDLSDQDLEGAHAVVLIYVDKPWESGQLERIAKYVSNGGTLLVMGEHTIHGPDADEMPSRKPYWPDEAHARFNDVLVDSSIRVNFDSATFAVGGWLQSYEALAHAMTAGVGDTRNEFGSVIGASLNVRWPAKPILIGKYGWNDPGDQGSAAAMMGNHKYDPGERLGDVILAAEDNVGKGRVVVFGDTSGITNGINVSTHDFNARLFSYISNSSLSPQATWRQFLGVALAVAAVVGFLRCGSAGARLATLAVFLGSLMLCQSITHANGTLLPDGRHTNPNKLAYIDQSHLETASQESWRDDGVMGLGMCLMRDGYVALTMSDFSKDRLQRAGILVSVAPNRPYSAEERKILIDWIKEGGIFILTVGWPERAGSAKLMDDLLFGFGKDRNHRATDKDPPEPQGFFKSPYIEANGYRAHVRFHAAWPIYCLAEDARPLAYGADNSSIIIRRPLGKGHVVMVGDTNFATNQNLEREGGEPFDGMRENNEFWRWLIADLTGQKPFIPTAPSTQPTGDAQ